MAKTHLLRATLLITKGKSQPQTRRCKSTGSELFRGAHSLPLCNYSHELAGHADCLVQFSSHICLCWLVIGWCHQLIISRLPSTSSATLEREPHLIRASGFPIHGCSVTVAFLSSKYLVLLMFLLPNTCDSRLLWDCVAGIGQFPKLSLDGSNTKSRLRLGHYVTRREQASGLSSPAE